MNQYLCVHELIEKQAEENPDAVAVVFEDKLLTYAELDKKANQLAFYLRKQGIKTDSLVAIYMDHSLEMVIGILAVLKARGAYVPLNTNFPDQFNRFIINDGKISRYLTTSNFSDKFGEYIWKKR